MEQENSVPECPVCFASYNNVFKTPLLLPCLHTFCMECLSKVCVFQKEQETFRCPVCRTVVTIPPGGVPQLPPNMNIVSQFPPWMGELQKVWMEGSKLCWKKGHGHNYVTSTQNTSHFPPGQEENMVISVCLLNPPALHFSQPADLLMAPQQSRYHRCKSISRKCGCILLGLFFLSSFLFTMLYMMNQRF